MLFVQDESVKSFGRAPVKARHRLHEESLFEEAALIDLLDRMPREYLFALTMGEDPTRADERRPASHEAVSGADLLEAVKRGRLWLNVTRVDTYEPRYRAALDVLFADLCRKVPGLQVDGRRATLLISSPTAQVYYHADGAPTALWHLRGRKRLFVYPADDERFLSRHDLEDIFAGVRTEYVPYRREFDQHAAVFDLAPGDVIAWPQNAPHRVVNLEGLNVSLSSEYFTPESRRRARLFTANRFLRKTLRIERLSTDASSVLAAPKIAVHRLGRALRLEESNTRRHVPVVRVDPSGPLGVSPLRVAAVLLTVRCLTRLDELRPFREAINALNAQSRAPDGFSTFEFFQTLLAAQPDAELRFLTVWDGQHLAGFLALRCTQEDFWGGRHPKLEFLASRDVDASRLVCRPEDEARCTEAIYRHLLSADQDWSMLELRQQYAESPLLAVPKALKLHRMRLFESKDNATIPVSRFGSVAEFHKACSKKHRNNVSRSVRALLGAGRLEHVSSDDPLATPALYRLYTALERRSWKDRAGATLGRDHKRGEVFRGLLAADQPMRLSVELLLLDGVPVAGLINGAFGNTLYALQIAHDEAFAELSPGTTALLLGIRRAIDGGFESYNLLSGFGYYKSRWLAEIRRSKSVQIFRTGRAHYWKSLLGDLKRRLTRTPAPRPGFNLVKREVGPATGPARLTSEERNALAELLRAVPRDRCVWLSAEDLRGLMPFDTREGSARDCA